MRRFPEEGSSVGIGRRLSRWAGAVGSALILLAASAQAQNPAPVQVFYLPIPEDDLLLALQTIEGDTTWIGAAQKPRDPVETYVSIAVFADNTIIYYDHWENGFDPNIANPINLHDAVLNPGGTQIWGDGNPANGFPPGYPSDLLMAGSVIILNNPVVTTNRLQINFDGGDKIAATKPIAVTRAGWASGSATLLAGANEVFDTAFFGTNFLSPVGVDIPDSVDFQAFEYTGASIMAGPGGSTIQIDADADGVFETTVTLAEGEAHLINGTLRVGGRINADRPVQVDLITADIFEGYESRFMRLLPVDYWTSSATTPVSTPFSLVAVDGASYTSTATTVWLYNPGVAAITVDYITRTGAGGTNLTTTTLTVPGGPAGGYLKQIVAPDYGARFVNTNGIRFHALAVIDSTGPALSTVGAPGDNRTWDWGFTLVPEESLTSQVLVGLGIGRDPTSAVNANENANPVWVTTIGNGNSNVTVYVDYDADPTTGPLTDPNGNAYDVAFSVRELDQLKIYNPAGDQSGMLVYVLDTGIKIAAAWGQDPLLASPGQPGLDMGTGIPPLPLFVARKDSLLVQDLDGDGFISPGDVLEYLVEIQNIGRQPVPDLDIADTLPPSVTYLTNTTVFVNATRATNSIPDGAVPPSATAFPLDEGGILLPESALPIGATWEVQYRVQILAYTNLPPGTIDLQNTALVGGVGLVFTNIVSTPLRGRIGDFVWWDLDGDGVQTAGEPGLNGVIVNLLTANGVPVLDDNNQPITAVTTNDGLGNPGYYEFLGVLAGDYIVEFIPPAGFVFTAPDADGLGPGGMLNSDAGIPNGRTEPFTLGGGEIIDVIDAGLVAAAAIGDFVWVDLNGNGLQDPDEPGLNGVTVRLLDSAGNPALDANGDPITTVTANDGGGNPGYYVFDGLYAGDYRVAFELPPGYAFTPPNADGLGVTGALNSDPDPSSGITPVFTLAVGQTLTAIDAGALDALRVAKTSAAAGLLLPGDTVTYTIVVSNAGVVVQTGVSIADAVPAGATFVAGSVTAALSPPALTITNTLTFNANDAFVVPAGVTNATLEVWGGGGGTRNDGTTRRGGGGGGAYARTVVGVSSGQTFTVVVGLGGAPAATTGNAGGASYVVSGVSTQVLARGGAGGADNGGLGGAAGTSIGETVFAGGAGGNRGGSSGGGGGGSATATGAGGAGAAGTGGTGGAGGTGEGEGGDGGNSGQSGQNGLAPGGGGGGRGNNGAVGGAGADGRVRITYEQILKTVGTTGTPPALASGWELEPGETLTLTYSVTIDAPAILASICNTAAASSAQSVNPVSATVCDPIDPSVLVSLESYRTGAYLIVTNRYYRDPEITGQTQDVIYVGGAGFLPATAYDVAYYDAQGLLVYTDTAAQSTGAGFLQSENPNTSSNVYYGIWTAVGIPDGATPAGTLAAQLADPATIITDTFEVRTWSTTVFTDADGNPATLYGASNGVGVVYIQTVDRDQNQDPLTIETVTVTLTNAATGDSETVTLYETGPDTGVFANDNLGNRLAFPITIAGPSIPGNGELSYAYGDTLQVLYTDASDPTDRSGAVVATLVVLGDFGARRSPAGVVVEWTTVSEYLTAGFYLERRTADGSWTRVNAELLAALPPSPEGAAYALLDAAAPGDGPLTYRLVEPELTGAVHLYGPFEVTVEGWRETAPAAGAERVRDTRGEQRARERLEQARRTARVAAPKGGPAVFGGPAPTLKAEVPTRGVYRLTAAALAAAAGQTPEWAADQIATGQVRLRRGGEPLAWTPAAPAALDFYADGYRSRYATNDAVFVDWGPGVLWGERTDAPASATTGASYRETRRFERNRYAPVAALRDAAEDFWMWDYLQAGHATHGSKHFPFALDAVTADGAPAQLVVELAGSTRTAASPDHHVVAAVNGQTLGATQWDGIGRHVLALEAPEGLLREGTNTLTLTAVRNPGVAFSIVYLNRFEVTYARQYAAVDGVLACPPAGHETLTVTGLRAPAIRVLEISAPDQPVELLERTIEAADGGYRVSFRTRAGDKRYLVYDELSIKSPARLRARAWRDFRAAQPGAEYVVIAPEEMRPEAQRLADRRAAQGLSAMVVELEEIHDAFNHGRPDPEAIRTLLREGRRSWARRPFYAVLVGAGTYDYFDDLGFGGNLIPPLMIGTPMGILPSDMALGDVSGGPAPEVVVGRLPVYGPAEFERVFNKIVAYEDGIAGRRPDLLASDNRDTGGYFSNDSRQLGQRLGSDARYLDLVPGQTAAFRTAFFAQWREGRRLVNWAGHGGVSALAHEGVLKTTDVPLLDNADAPTVLVGLTCLLSQFAIPGADTLGVRLLREPQGAAAVWGPSGTAYQRESLHLGRGFYNRVGHGGALRLGLAIRSAFAGYEQTGSVDRMYALYNLLGDPALSLTAGAPGNDPGGGAGGGPGGGAGGGAPPWAQARIVAATSSTDDGHGASSVVLRLSLPAGTPGGAIRIERARDLVRADWQPMAVVPVSAGWIADGQEQWLLTVPAPEDGQPFFLRVVVAGMESHPPVRLRRK